MRKTLIGLFDSDTSFDRAAERPKNRSQQVFPTHADCPKKEERFAGLEAPLYATNAAVLGSSSRRPPHRFVTALGGYALQDEVTGGPNIPGLFWQHRDVGTCEDRPAPLPCVP